MKELKLSVKGGGLDGFSCKYRRPDTNSRLFKTIGKELGLNPKELSLKYKEEDQMSLVRPQAIEGIILRLMGENNKVVDIHSAAKNHPLLKDVKKAMETVKFNLTKKPYFEVVASRPQIMMTVDPGIKIDGLSLDSGKGLILFFKEQIISVFGNKTLGDIYDSIYKKEEEEYEKVTKEHIQLAKELISEFQSLSKKYSDLKIKMFSPTLERLAAISKTKVGDSVHCLKEYALTVDVLKVHSEIAKALTGDKDLAVKLSEINSGALFPKTSKDWTTEVKYVTHQPEMVLKFDFDMFLVVSDEMHELIIGGDRMASFGRKGVVSVVDDTDGKHEAVNELTYVFTTHQVKHFEDFQMQKDSVSLKSYNILSEKPLRPYDCHAIMTRLFKKNESGERIDTGVSVLSSDKKTLLVRTPLSLACAENKSIEIEDLSKKTKTKYKVKELPEESYSFSKSEKVVVSGTVSIEVKRNMRKLSAYNPDGSVREWALAGLLQQNGLKVESILSSEKVEMESRGKVRIENVVKFTAECTVTSNYYFCRALSFGIGRRRSYGLGGLIISPMVKANKKAA